MKSLHIIGAFVFTFICFDNCAQSPDKSIPFWNAKHGFEERAKDLVSRLTLEEKVAQMLNHAPAIERFGIPAYDWWNEVLHGVARTPYHTTSFPQAIAMAATWDTLSLQMMANYAAIEGRAVYNKALSQGKNHERYMGLTYWTPNINIFRDPRWGRGQETYGEDPFLTAKLGAAFVRGLQGSDTKYLKAAACAKHFAVHSGPEPSRHIDNFNPSAYDLWDTYLPAFKELITKANVEGVMCAYNALYGQPCCASNILMNDILRQQWKFDGYVTSDCWAIDDFFKYHKTHADKTSSSVDAVLHGTDVECGTDVYLSLIDGVEKGLISEKQIDVSVERLFVTRLKLGMFDPAELVPFARTSEQALEAEDHKAHSLKMAQQSIVLLKNENNTLPLKKNMKKVVVLGPNADNKIAILGNYNGIPSKVYTVLEGIKNKLGKDTEVIYEKAVDFTSDSLMVYRNNYNLFYINNKAGFKAEYYNNEDLKGSPVHIGQEDKLDFYWPEGKTPAIGINSIHFSARFTSQIKFHKDETLNFEIEGDDGYKVFINDSLYINAWTRNRWGAKSFLLKGKKDQNYKIVIEYRQGEGNASIALREGHYATTNFNDLIKKYADTDAFIFVGGISPQLEGEEMPVNLPGFDGGDKTTINLPAIQSKFLAALAESKKNVVFVMMTGSAIAVPKEDQTIPAIINAWYGGQAAGIAIADVLFGDYNPGGRLPVTFYAKDEDLPDFKSYSMDNRTYRYFKGEPLYPFGYGLSYTKFEYQNLMIKTNASLSNVEISVQIKNVGNLDGEEVAQLYLDHPDYKGRAPIHSLKGFKRILVNKGETVTVNFILDKDALSIVDEHGHNFIPQSAIRLSVGGGQPNAKKQTSNIVTKTFNLN